MATTIAKPTASSVPEDAGVVVPDAVARLEPGESLAISARPTATSMANVWIALGDDALALDVTACR